MMRSLPAWPSMPLPMPGSPTSAMRRGLIILGDEVVEVVVGLQNHAAAAAAVAAAGAALGDVGFAMERHAAFAAVPGPRVNFDFVNEHIGVQ